MVGGATPFTWNFGSSGPVGRLNRRFWMIFVRSASAFTQRKKFN